MAKKTNTKPLYNIDPKIYERFKDYCQGRGENIRERIGKLIALDVKLTEKKRDK